MKVAVVGATGLVGRTMIQLLEERNFQVAELIPVASEQSFGKEILFKGNLCKVIKLQEAIDKKPDIALFSAGASVSTEWAKKFSQNGTTVIDNSSAWRMDFNVPLIVPEINSRILTKEDKLIANPNCSTIQLVAALGPLHSKFCIQRIIASTYQSVSGTGIKGINQLENERSGVENEMVYPYRIDLNIIPQGGDFYENGYTSEEIKLTKETQKIFNDDSIRVTSTVVRVPVLGGHSISANIEFACYFDMEDIRNIIKSTPGLVLMDDTKNNIYPMPYYIQGKDEVFIGRLRRDETRQHSINMWIVADNVRKGAATNAIQIAEYLVEKGMIGR